MLRSVFKIEGDVLASTGMGVKGPGWILGLCLISLLIAMVLALVHVTGLAPGRLAAWGALACGGLALLSLGGMALIWPRYGVRLDRISRRLEIRDGSGSRTDLPVEEVRFAIRPRRPWYLFSRQPAWAFIAKTAVHDDLQLYFTVRKDRVETLWQELGKWLARGAETQNQAAVGAEGQGGPRATGQEPVVTGQGPRATGQSPASD